MENPLHIYVDIEAQNTIIEQKGRGIFQLKARTGSFKVGIKEYRDALLRIESQYKGERLNTEKLALKEKFKEVVWIYQLAPNGLPHVDDTTSFNETTFGELEKTVSIEDLQVGGGFVYIQPYLKKENYIPEVSLAYGAIYFSFGQPDVIGARWFEDKKAERPIAQGTQIAFGSTVYLRVHTKDLYGQLIDIQFKDDDSMRGRNEGDNSDDDLGIYPHAIERETYVINSDIPVAITKDKLIKRMISTLSTGTKPDGAIIGLLVKEDKNKEDKKSSTIESYQGTIFAVYIDPFWSKEANDFLEGSSIEVFPTVFHPRIPNKMKIFKSEATLNVSKNGTVLNPNEAQYNLPVLAGEVESDYTNFLPCKYEKVIGKYEKGDNTMEIEIFPLVDDSQPTQLTFPIVAGVKGALADFSINLEGVKTDSCNHEGTERDHTGKVIDISKILNLIKQGRGQRSSKWRAHEYEEKNASSKSIGSPSPESSRITNKFTIIEGDLKFTAQDSFKVLEDYKPFVLEQPTDELLELQVGYDYSWNKSISVLRGLAMTLWPNSPGIAQKFPINLNTCAHALPLNILVYPDTKWTMQIAFNYKGDEFNELREAYHDKWALNELAADEDLQNLRRREEGIPDREYLNTRRRREDAKKKRARIRRDRAKAENRRLKARRNQSKMSQARHMMGELRNPDLIECEFTLMCEFDQPNEAIEFSSAFDEMLEFLKKIVRIKDLFERIINGTESTTTEHSPNEGRQSSRNRARQDRLKEKLNARKASSNWSFEFTPPSVALSISWCADAPVDLKTPVMGTLIEGAIDLDPLFGFEIKYDVYQLLYKIKHPAVLAVVATLDVLDEALGDRFDINLDLIVTSEISGSLKGTINTAEGSSFTGRLMKDDEGSPCKFGGKVEVELKGYIQANGPVETFLFGKYDAYAEVTADAKTGISIECVTKADEKSIFVEPTIKFEGFILGGSFKAGAVKPSRGTGSATISDMKEADGLHYAADGKIVVLDPYEWETGWSLSVISF